jgi:hypothetical protein
MPRKLFATQTQNPKVPLSRPIPKIDDTERAAIGNVLTNLIQINLGNRSRLDQNLDIWNAILEMRGKPLNIPWEGASHIVGPTVYTAYYEFCSRTIGSCLQPRPYTLRGTDPISAQYAHTVEQFYNSEWDNCDSFDAHELCIRYGARDGVAIMEVLYDLSTHEEMFDVEEGVFDDNAQAVLGPDGNPLTKTTQKVVKFVDYDAPREEAVDLKSFLLLPNFARTINSAPGVARKVWLTEQDMQAKVKAGYWDQDTVDAIIQYCSEGEGEQARDPQGNSQYTISGMISVVDTAISGATDIPIARGPYEFWRIHTNLFDLNKDGLFEENIFWLHDSSRKNPGVVPYDYFGGRPFFDLAMIPRPGVFYGFSIPEIGRAQQEENDTQTNSRLNLLDLSTRPNRYRTQGVRYRNDNGTSDKWDLDVEIEVTKPDDFGFVKPPQIPPESMIEQEKITAILDRALGSPQAPAAAPPVGGVQQRSARAAAFQAQLIAMNLNLVNERVRRWMLKIYRFKAGLYQRYGPDQLETSSEAATGPARMVVPKEILALDYKYGISGLGGALDKEQRRQDVLMLTQGLLDTPLQALFVGNLPRLWNLARLLVETYDVPDITTYIGTLDEAQQLQVAQQKAAADQAQLDAMMQILSHGATPAGGPSKPAAPPQPAPQPALQALQGGRR